MRQETSEAGAGQLLEPFMEYLTGCSGQQHSEQLIKHSIDKWSIEVNSSINLLAFGNAKVSGVVKRVYNGSWNRT